MPANDSLMKFGAYTKAHALFDSVVADVALLSRRRECDRLFARQFASAGSIAANIDGGHGRGTEKEYCHLLVISPGSAQATAGRCLRLRRWLPAGLPEFRIALCDEIIGTLTASIRKLPTQSGSVN